MHTRTNTAAVVELGRSLVVSLIPWARCDDEGTIAIDHQRTSPSAVPPRRSLFRHPCTHLYDSDEAAREGKFMERRKLWPLREDSRTLRWPRLDWKRKKGDRRDGDGRSREERTKNQNPTLQSALSSNSKRQTARWDGSGIPVKTTHYWGFGGECTRTAGM